MACYCMGPPGNCPCIRAARGDWSGPTFYRPITAAEFDFTPWWSRINTDEPRDPLKAMG